MRARYGLAVRVVRGFVAGVGLEAVEVSKFEDLMSKIIEQPVLPERSPSLHAPTPPPFANNLRFVELP